MKCFCLVFFTMLWSTSLLADLSILSSEATVRDPIPGMNNSVGFVRLTNTSNSDVVLVSAKAEFTKHIEFHDHELIDGVMKMYRVENVVIPAGETIHFQTGGLHLMLISIEPLEPKLKTVEITFITDTKEEFKVPFEVETIKMKHAHH